MAVFYTNRCRTPKGIQEIFKKEKGLEVTASVDAAEKSFLNIGAYRPDIVILELDRLSINKSIKMIREINADIKIIMLTSVEDKSYVVESLKYEVSGYLLKGMSSEALAEGVRCVSNGYPYFHPKVHNILINECRRLSEKEQDRERERKEKVFIVPDVDLK